MTKQKLVELYQNLKNLGELKGVKFAYGVAKNIGIIQPEIEALQKAINPTEDFSLFEKERIELAKNHSKKDDKGNPIIENNQFIMEDTEKFSKEFEALKENHKEAIYKREKQTEDYNNLLKEEIEINLYKIKISDVPQDISAKQLEGIFGIIENDGY